eukprot:COSAG05_NODE_66_length_22253_cov_14.954455_12_plen_67_part_00
MCNSVLIFSEVWWAGRKFGRGSAALVDREGNLELQGCLAEAWLVKDESSHPAGLLNPCLRRRSQTA